LLSTYSRTWLAVCGVACSLLANVSGELYPMRAQTSRHHRVGQNCRAVRYALGETDHAHEIETPRQVSAGAVAQAEHLYQAGLTPIAAPAQAGVSLYTPFFADEAITVPEVAESSAPLYPPSAARPPPVRS
jgi:hypothetical protein